MKKQPEAIFEIVAYAQNGRWYVAPQRINGTGAGYLNVLDKSGEYFAFASRKACEAFITESVLPALKEGKHMVEETTRYGTDTGDKDEICLHCALGLHEHCWHERCDCPCCQEQETPEAEESASPSAAQPMTEALYDGVCYHCHRFHTSAQEQGIWADYGEDGKVQHPCLKPEICQCPRCYPERHTLPYEVSEESARIMAAQGKRWDGFRWVSMNLGGARPGAGRKPDPSRFDERSYQAGYKAGERAKTTKLLRKTEQVWQKYEGDTCIAIVQDGKCVRGWMHAQTYGAISTRDGRSWWWVGCSVEELKENHFSYSHTTTRYFGAKTGREYVQYDDGTWMVEWEQDGEIYEAEIKGPVEISEP